MKVRPVALLGAAVALSFFVSACSSADNPASVAQPSQTLTAPASTTSSSITSGPNAASSEVASTTTATTDSSPSPIGPQNGTRTLTLADAFKPGNWKEGAFAPTGQTPAQAMAITVDCYDSHNATTMEFRFSRATGKLQFTVAQGDTSNSSDAVLEWALTVDGRQTEAKTIGFKDTAVLSTDLTGVAAVKISAKQKLDQRCTGDVTALITKAVVTG